MDAWSGDENVFQSSFGIDLQSCLNLVLETFAWSQNYYHDQTAPVASIKRIYSGLVLLWLLK